jgi:hypothetical protein
VKHAVAEIISAPSDWFVQDGDGLTFVLLPGPTSAGRARARISSDPIQLAPATGGFSGPAAT